MKKYFIFSSVFIISSAFAQVGINTANPQQIFHVDGKFSANSTNSSTEIPTPLQQVDDVVVTKNGNLGIGTINPTHRLHIKSASTGAIKIVDGTQGDGKVLMTDKDGVATWQMPGTLKDLVRGVFYRTSNGAEIQTNSDDTSARYKYLNGDIKLTKGKWIINAGTTLKTNIANGQKVWVNMYISTSTSANSIALNGFVHLGPAGSNSSMAGLLHGYKDVLPNGADNDNFIMGSNFIEVTDDEITLYLMIQNLATTINGVDTGRKYYTTSGYWENYFYAIPLNN